MIYIGTIFLLAAFICFLLGVTNIAVDKTKLISAGLALWTLSLLITQIKW